MNIERCFSSIYYLLAGRGKVPQTNEAVGNVARAMIGVQTPDQQTLQIKANADTGGSKNLASKHLLQSVCKTNRFLDTNTSCSYQITHWSTSTLTSTFTRKPPKKSECYPYAERLAKPFTTTKRQHKKQAARPFFSQQKDKKPPRRKRTAQPLRAANVNPTHSQISKKWEYIDSQEEDQELPGKDVRTPKRTRQESSPLCTSATCQRSSCKACSTEQTH